MSARDEILTRVRAGLQKARAVAVPSTLERRPFPRFADGLASKDERVARFRSVLEGVGGQSAVVRDVDDAAALLGAWLQARAAKTLAVSDGDLAREVAAATPGATIVEPSATREVLLDANAGITGARLAVAETGTCALASADERSRLASLVPPLAVTILRAEDIVTTLEAALAELKPIDPAAHSRAVTFVTGPSRTADIEMTLVVGVHGPKELLVIILDSEAAALERS